MKYNTEEKMLPLPEYGRSIQNMVDHALTITDRAERQRCANTIIAIMGNMNTQLRDIPDFKHKLWDHLAIMSNFKLDIDYPYDIIKKDNLTSKPAKVPYPKNKITYMHYGYNLQEMIKIVATMPEGAERKILINQLSNMMKKDYLAWAKDIADENKIIKDIFTLSNGALELKPGDITFFEQRNFNNKRNNKKPVKRTH